MKNIYNFNRIKLALSARNAIMINIQNDQRAAGQIAPNIVLKYEDLKGQLNVFNMRCADLLMGYRVYYMLNPLELPFAPFLDKQGIALTTAHDIIHKKVFRLLQKEGVIDAEGARVKPFPYDLIPNEINNLFKLVNGRVELGDNNIFETMVSKLIQLNNGNISSDDDSKGDNVFSRLSAQSTGNNQSVTAPLSSDSSELTKRDKIFLNNITIMMGKNFDQRDQQLFDKLDTMHGKGKNAFTDSVTDMLKSPHRGTSYFSQDYSVGKDKEAKGFKLIANDIMSEGADSRSRKLYQGLMNNDYSGKDKIRFLHGK